MLASSREVARAWIVAGSSLPSCAEARGILSCRGQNRADHCLLRAASVRSAKPMETLVTEMALNLPCRREALLASSQRSLAESRVRAEAIGETAYDQHPGQDQFRERPGITSHDSAGPGFLLVDPSGSRRILPRLHQPLFSQHARCLVACSRLCWPKLGVP